MNTVLPPPPPPPPLLVRDGPLGVPAFVKIAYYFDLPSLLPLFWGHSMQIAPSRAYFRSGPKLKHIDRCGCHLYYQRFCNGYSAPKSINQCLYITMEIGPYSCFHIWNSHEDGAISIVYIYITMEIGPCQWEVNIAFYWIRGYFHSNIYRKLSKRVLMYN